MKDVGVYRGPECRTDHYMVNALCIREVRKVKVNWTRKLKSKFLNVNYIYFMVGV